MFYVSFNSCNRSTQRDFGSTDGTSTLRWRYTVTPAFNEGFVFKFPQTDNKKQRKHPLILCDPPLLCAPAVCLWVIPPPIWEDDFKGREATVDELWGWAKDWDKINIAYIMAWWKNENIELDNSSPLKPVCLLILWLVLNFYNHFVFNY